MSGFEATFPPRGDAELFLTAVQTIYEAAMQPSAWPDALTAIARVFGGVGSVLLFQREDSSTGTVVSPTLEAAQQAYDAGWWREDICFVRVTERALRTEHDAIADQHMVTEEESTSHPFFTDFLVPHGMGRLAATGLAPARGTPVFLSTHRFIDRPRFTDSELVLLAHIGRHVENALRLGIRLIAADVAKIVLGDALACLGAAVFLVDSLGRVVFMNVRGEALLGDALVLTGKRLSARVGTSTSAFEETLNLAISNLAGTARVRPRPIILHGNDPTEFFAAYIQPVPVLVESSPALMFSDVKAAVVVMSSRASDPPDPSLVRDLLGVTLSEARLAALVGSGITPRQAADQLGVAEETARSALKRVFEKTGITRQSQLAGLLGRLVMR